MRKRVLRAAALALACCLALAPAAAAGDLTLAYLYGGAEALDKAGSAVNEAAPVWLDLEADGSLRIAPAMTRAQVQALHRRGVRVVPMLSNHWDRALGQAALENAEALASQLAKAVDEYDLDGVQLDLENLTGEHRAAHVDMVRRVREALPAGKTVAVAIPANPKGFTTGWHASYDTEALARQADYLMLMAYDEHYRGSAPGPVASAAFVEAGILAALDTVPAEKLVLGVPLYGRIWREDGDNLTGQGLGDGQIRALLQSHGGTAERDAASGSVQCRLTVAQQRPGESVAGIPLTPGTYIIWFEDETSKKGLLSLAERYGLRGAGLWRLGQEDEGLWDYLALWRAGLPMEDLEGHWAMEAAIAAASAGWMRGVSPTSFAPDRVLTRAEAAAMLGRMLALPAEHGGASFSDTRGHWAEAEIARAAAAGLVSGVGGGRFDPDAPVTREQLAAMLHRAARRQGADTGPSPALPAGHGVSPFAREAMAWAVDQGLLLGTSHGLAPQDTATRAQAAAILSRYQKRSA